MQRTPQTTKLIVCELWFLSSVPSWYTHPFPGTCNYRLGNPAVPSTVKIHIGNLHIQCTLGPLDCPQPSWRESSSSPGTSIWPPHQPNLITSTSILEHLYPVAFKWQLPALLKIHWVFHISLLKLHTENIWLNYCCPTTSTHNPGGKKNAFSDKSLTPNLLGENTST